MVLPRGWCRICSDIGHVTCPRFGFLTRNIRTVSCLLLGKNYMHRAPCSSECLVNNGHVNKYQLSTQLLSSHCDTLGTEPSLSSRAEQVGAWEVAREECGCSSAVEYLPAWTLGSVPRTGETQTKEKIRKQNFLGPESGTRSVNGDYTSFPGCPDPNDHTEIVPFGQQLRCIPN